MKNFILNIISGFVVFCVIWYVAEIAITKVGVINDYSYKYKHVQNNPSIKTLLIGNSYFENSVNPYLLGDSVFDFANGGRWIYYDVQLTQKVLPTMPNLKTVIFPISYHMPYGSWHYRGLSDIDKNYAYNYARYMNTFYDRFPENIYLSSSLIANKMGVRYWKNGITSQDTLGYSPIQGQQNEWEKWHNVVPTVFDGDTANLCYNEFRNYLTQLAQVCYDNDVRFIVVTCPCADCYVVNTREQGIKKLYALIDSVAAHYPIEYKNYLNDEEFRADSIYFNSSHLNSIGADMFAKRLKTDFNL